MKAAIAEHLRQPAAIKDVPKPTPGPNDVLVRVVTAGVNPIDWKTRERGERAMPFVLGQDFAGVVSDVGQSVHKYRNGERVFGIAREHGSYAEYTIVPQDDAAQPVAKIPDDVGDADAAGLPTPGLTALASLDALGVKSGTTLLIVGATGGVGTCAVQIARTRDARILGIAHSRSESMARDLGVEEFYAYDTGDAIAAVKSAHPKGIDAVLDLVDTNDAIAATIETLRPGGSIVSTIGALDDGKLQARHVSGSNLVVNQTPESSHASLRTLAELVEGGQLRVLISSEEPLDEAERALKNSQSGSVNGKIILTIA